MTQRVIYPPWLCLFDIRLLRTRAPVSGLATEGRPLPDILA